MNSLNHSQLFLKLNHYIQESSLLMVSLIFINSEIGLKWSILNCLTKYSFTFKGKKNLKRGKAN